MNTAKGKKAHFLLHSIFERDEGRLRNEGGRRGPHAIVNHSGQRASCTGGEAQRKVRHAYTQQRMEGPCAVQLEFELWGWLSGCQAVGLPAAAVDSSGVLALPARRWRPVRRLRAPPDAAGS